MKQVKTQAARRRHLVKALRSGKYKQGKVALESTAYDGEVRNCCLGVACRVAIKDGLTLDVSDGMTVRFDDNSSCMPPSVRDWYGFSWGSGVYDTNECLTNDNDCREKTFDEIADIIESEPEGMFVGCEIQRDGPAGAIKIEPRK